ncbi:MAG: SpoIIE family protein phosphatase [Crocinitomicaceae bacterium]|nr:SpoIIE family protein phosphatase [Crocinitomicaceae bacterium]
MHKKSVEYAAANNAPILIRDRKIHELATDKMPVGHGEKPDSFKLNKIDLQAGDRLYFYTDGYADQFGGPNGKKFKYKNSTKCFEISLDSCESQKEKLKTVFENWKGTLEQVDDVCVLGIQF